MTVTVLIADDQELIRAGFAALIDATDGLEVVGQAADGDAALAATRALRPDVVLMDIRMPGSDGLTATEAIAADPDLAGVHVIILTTFEADDYVLRAIRAGAAGFLSKAVRPQALLDGIRDVAAGESLLSPSATRTLIESFLDREAEPHVDLSGAEGLTAREAEVVGLAAQGLSNSDIAAKLFLSPLTVKTHVNRAMTKVGARDRAQLVVFAYRTGLSGPSSSPRA